MRERMYDEVQWMYFDWLLDLVDEMNHKQLLIYLHTLDYRWGIKNDINRAMDGVALRDRFNWEGQYKAYQLGEEPCSVLEFIIGVASRMDGSVAGMGDGEITDIWFWNLMENLGLDKFDDVTLISEGCCGAIDDIINRLLDRTYESNGYGGLFPLNSTDEDQRGVEVWYQMSEYIIENELY